MCSRSTRTRWPTKGMYAFEKGRFRLRNDLIDDGRAADAALQSGLAHDSLPL